MENTFLDFIHNCSSELSTDSRVALSEVEGPWECCSVCACHLPPAQSYYCSRCDFFVHKSCFETLPQEINHPFHPQHPLTCCRDNDVYFYCNACGSEGCGFVRFFCSECQFSLRVPCGSLMPIQNHELVLSNNNNNDNQTSLDNRHPRGHPLIPCVMTKKDVSLHCTACHEPLDMNTIIYVCLECKFLLHESCSKIPYKIRHPFHPQHSLVLSRKRRAVCTACQKSIEAGCTYSYEGAECEFCLGAECVSLMLTVKFKLHRHPLALFTNRRTPFSCVKCPCRTCKPVFRCVMCDFNIHQHCAPTLPITATNPCHRHSLTLTNSPVKDSPEDDYGTDLYCDVCEEGRHLACPTYYCAECHFVGHVFCMISEEDIVGEEPCMIELDKETEAKERIDTVNSRLAELDEEIRGIGDKTRDTQGGTRPAISRAIGKCLSKTSKSIKDGVLAGELCM